MESNWIYVYLAFNKSDGSYWFLKKDKSGRFVPHRKINYILEGEYYDLDDELMIAS